MQNKVLPTHRADHHVTCNPTSMGVNLSDLCIHALPRLKGWVMAPPNIYSLETSLALNTLLRAAKNTDSYPQ